MLTTPFFKVGSFTSSIVIKSKIVWEVIRRTFLTLLNITILRFDNSQIMQNCDAVLQIIMDTIYKTKNPPARYAHDPLFQSG